MFLEPNWTYEAPPEVAPFDPTAPVTWPWQTEPDPGPPFENDFPWDERPAPELPAPGDSPWDVAPPIGPLPTDPDWLQAFAHVL